MEKVLGKKNNQSQNNKKHDGKKGNKKNGSNNFNSNNAVIVIAIGIMYLLQIYI